MATHGLSVSFQSVPSSPILIVSPVRLERKWSLIGACSGIIAGLVGVTPAAGFIGSPAAFAIGVIVSACCNLATKIKFWVGIDDSLDVRSFATHRAHMPTSECLV